MTRLLGAALCAALALAGAACAQPAPQAPRTPTALRVEAVAAAARQPVADAPETIWYESFDQPDLGARCFEYDDADGGCVPTDQAALVGPQSLGITWQPGQVSAGGVKVLFGRSPFRRGLRRDETFREIWWRQYVRHQPGWQGNPAKLSRATCLVTANWAQGLLAHVWGGKGLNLCLDPASGITDSQLRSTRYNDFERLRWIGYAQGATPFFDTAESGRWWLVEAHVRLNTPGVKDGVFELWLDGLPEARRDDLDWYGTWDEYAINAVFFENYWNDGSPVEQQRWFDDLVVATAPIGPLTAAWPLAVTLVHDPGRPWQLRFCRDGAGLDVALTVDVATGRTWRADPATPVLPDGRYWCQVRAGDEAWSASHMPFELAE